MTVDMPAGIADSSRTMGERSYSRRCVLQKYLPPVGSLVSNWAPVLAVSVALIATWVAVIYAGQPLLELESFRQTATALTSYWMIHEGWQLAYQTPALGYPWQIPFEFPIYQSIVALIAWIGKFPLNSVGRLVSFVFLIACAWPAFQITWRLNLPSQVAWVFCALLWSSPIYLFYGRTFLIETAAVFFIFSAIPYGIDLLNHKFSFSAPILFSIYSTLGILQKITTALPVLIIMALVLIVAYTREHVWLFARWRNVMYVVLAFSVPIAIGALWTSYADYVKAKNLFAVDWNSGTSWALEWYFGDIAQRFDLDRLLRVFWYRTIEKNAGGFLGVALIIGSLSSGSYKTRIIVSVSLALFCFPMLVFFHVHWFLEYYQVASVLFLVAALAISAVVWLPTAVNSVWSAPLTASLLILWNLSYFWTDYSDIVTKKLNVLDTQTLAVADIIERYTPNNSGIVVFGLGKDTGFNPQFVYYSQRKGLTVDRFWEERVRGDPAAFLGGKQLGAMVFCGDIEAYSDIIKKHELSELCFIQDHEL